MSRVVEHLAELTGYRDRDVLDVTLVGALQDLLQPQAVAVYRCVGEPGAQHWLTRARLTPGDTVATADPLWAEPESLPALAKHPDRHACLLRQEPLLVDAGLDTAAKAYFPLLSDTQVVGVIEIATHRLLPPDSVRTVGAVLRIYRNFQSLLDYSERDTLTGLLNRKTFDDSFSRVALRQPEAAEPGPAVDPRRGAWAGSTWLAVIDIDHFKRVNDNHGHLIGDEVLLLLSRLMRSTFRCDDHLYRFGGEEFVVLVRCAGLQAAAATMERLRANVERYVFPQVGRITVSLGFTELRAGDSPSAAFERADKAVYHVKEHGRNQVAHHGDLVAAGALVEEAPPSSEVELF